VEPFGALPSKGRWPAAGIGVCRFQEGPVVRVRPAECRSIPAAAWLAGLPDYGEASGLARAELTRAREPREAHTCVITAPPPRHYR
jgi:hypothetical protein